jgi:hypothetical protein
MPKGGKRTGAGRPKNTKKNLNSKRISVPFQLIDKVKSLINNYKRSN